MTLYAVRPNPDTGSLEAEDAEVVDELRDGWDFLYQAIDVWRLVDAQRANEITAIKDCAIQAADGGEIRLYTEDLHKLVPLLAGIDEALVSAGIVDHDWRVPADRLEELKKHVPAMDLKTERTLANKTSALAEVMINALSIRNFFADALEAGYVIALG